MTILVTGAGGFIGSHLCEAALLQGYEVRALAHYRGDGRAGWLDSLSPDVQGSIDIRLGDVTDAGQVRNLMEGCDGVLHLAALIGIPYSYEAPASYLRTNIDGTFNVLEAARTSGCRVVVTSTSEVYGTAQFVPMTEDHPVSPQSPYAASKVAADALALSYHRSFDVPVSVLRPFNTFGPRQSLRAIIPTIIAQLLAGDGVVRLGNISATRDLLFVTDTADAFLRVFATPSTVGRTVQVATGFEIAVGDLAVLIGRRMGIDVEIVIDDDRLRPEASEVERLAGHPGLAGELMGWAPSGSGVDYLSRGLDITIDWMRNHDPRSLHRAAAYHR